MRDQHTGVVVDEVERAERRDARVDGGADRGGVAHVRLDCPHLRAVVRERVGGALRPGADDVGQNHGGAGRREQPRRLTPDAVRSIRRKMRSPISSMLAVPSITSPQLMSMSSSFLTHSAVLVESFNDGEGAQP